MRKLFTLLSVLFISTLLVAQTYEVPEMMYFQFDETGSDSTINLANPGVGGTYADVLGSLTMGPTGQFNDGLIGSGGSGTTDYVNTGWATSLSGSFTISMYLNNFTSTTTLHYLFGDPTTAGLRCFTGGIAGAGGVMLRLSAVGGTDITIAGVSPGPSVVTFVYDAPNNVAMGYLNGVLSVTVPQAGPVIASGTGPFKVAGYSSSNGLPAGSVMDEFRFYNRALDAAEVAATWNQTLPFIVPVELTSFAANVTGNDVTLNWTTATETNNSGFEIERKSNGSFEVAGFVAGFGTTTETKSYSFVDENLQTGTYTYRLKQIDHDGTFEYSDEIEVDVIAPAEFLLNQNYPNPFNPSTKITFALAEESNVTLSIFNVLGEEVTTILNTDLAAGEHEVDFNASGLNSGVYFYQLNAIGISGEEFKSVKKMILSK